MLSGAASGELVSLAHGSLSALTDGTHGAILDNTTLLDLYGDFTLTTGTLGGAPIVRGKFILLQWVSTDGTNYETNIAAGATTPDIFDPSNVVGEFVFSSTGTSQVMTITRVPLIPGKIKFQLYNLSGQALPATGSGVVCVRYNLTSI